MKSFTGGDRPEIDTVVFTHLHCISLSKQYIESIEIDIRTYTGDRVPYNTGKVISKPIPSAETGFHLTAKCSFPIILKDAQAYSFSREWLYSLDMDSDQHFHDSCGTSFYPLLRQLENHLHRTDRRLLHEYWEVW